jgi:hypothetical protein
MRPRSLLLAFATVMGLLVAVFPAVSSATVSEDPGGGYIEVCKTFTASGPSYQGTFTYDITDGRYSNTVTLSALQGGPQECTQPIYVPSGTATVTEETAPWFKLASITGTQGDPGSVTPDLSSDSATLQVLPAPGEDNESLTTTVEFTNDPVTGVIEVCKQPAANSPSLTGTYNFTITSTDSGINTYDSTTGAYDDPWSTTASATISPNGVGCSGPITVPAGTVETVEPGTTYVTGITAVSNGNDELLGTDPAKGTGDETVLAGDTTDQTIVTYSDALSTVKLCKEWYGDDTPNTVFPFSLTSSGAAGPTTVSGSVGLTAGSCQIVGTVRAGTQVNITELVTPGTKVAAINVNPTSNSQGNSPVVPGTLSLPNRTVSIIAGAGETDITYVDEAADPGTLKICVAPTEDPATGTVPFTVNGTQTIDVNLSSTAIQCTWDEATPFAYDGPVTISGGALPANDAFVDTPTVVPTSVEVYEDGSPVDTNQATLTASTASSATVLMSEGMVTEVTFTIDPPAPVTGPTVTQVIAPIVTGGGLTVSGTPTPASSTPATTSPVVVSTPAISPSLLAKVEKLDKQLTSVKSQIKTLDKRLASHHHLSVAARRADRHRLAQLRTLEAKILRELKL